MRHFSCDGCGRALSAGEAGRYVVRVEGYPAADAPDDSAAGLDTDHVADMADLLEELDDADDLAPPGLAGEYDL
jgi:hypothetical protein